MKKSLDKITFWAGALVIYILMIAAVFVLLFEWDAGQFQQKLETSPYIIGGRESVASLSNDGEQAVGFKRLLLPLGPDDGRLPGFPALWKEFLREQHADTDGVANDGFDGLQAVASIAELSKGAVTELFLSGVTAQVFRRGRFLLVLNELGNVQVIDCVNPRKPVLSGNLPYRQVKQLKLQGDVAYLLTSPSGAQQDTMIIADVSNPLKPRELSRFNLPLQAVLFFFQDRHLLVYSSSRGYKGSHLVQVYGISDDFRFTSLGFATCPPIGRSFLKYEDYLLTQDQRAGLNIIDFKDPLHPVLAASLVFPDLIKMLSRHGDVAFALGTKNRIYAIDLHDPLHPVLSAEVKDANYPATFLSLNQYTYFFTGNGYLRVFDTPPADNSAGGEKWQSGIHGELMATPSSDGFLLLGKRQGGLPPIVTEILELPEDTHVVDTLYWKDFMTVLDADGLVRFFRDDKQSLPSYTESLKLPPVQHWIAASEDRMYVGGEAGINVISRSDDGHFVLSGHIEFTDKGSWDGVVIQQTLCVAAGKRGILTFSVKQPDRPALNHGWTIPRHLESQIDVRQLAVPGGDRLLASAGPVGLLSGRINAGGRFRLEGIFNFPAPIYAIAIVGDFCLVSCGTDVCIIDIESRDSLQNLGTIAFPGIKKFAVASPDLWAGYVPGSGWSVLPAPHLVPPGTAVRTKLAEMPAGRYRLNLFNDYEFFNVPGVLSLSSPPERRTAGTVHGIE